MIYGNYLYLTEDLGKAFETIVSNTNVEINN